MHIDALKIYTDQLRDGREKSIDESLSPDFLDIHEQDLKYVGNIEVHGKAYLADSDLIVNLDITAHGVVPCSICNEPVEMTIEIPNFYHAESLAEVKTGIFDFGDVIREAILLETPPFTECNNGACPKRKELKKYLKEPQSKEIEERYHPFADLDL